MTAAAGLALAAAPAGARSGRDASSRTFVLVHGAWHGGWCWTKVRTLLEEAGARVLAPTLSGLGERRHDAAPPPRLAHHVAEIAELLHYEDLRAVTLVGHSYAGMVITGAADRASERLSGLIYLDAAVPRDGQSMITQKPGVSVEETEATRAALAALAPDGVWMGVLPLEGYGYVGLSGEERAWIAERLTPHPLSTWTETLRLANGGGAHLPRAYVHCMRPPLPMSSMPFHAALLKNDPTWRYREIASGHGAMLTAPAAVASTLLELAAG